MKFRRMLQCINPSSLAPRGASGLKSHIPEQADRIMRLAPRGASGLKSFGVYAIEKDGRLAPRGASGLK